MQDGVMVRLGRTCEFLLGALFLSAAVLKLGNVPLFASQILSYGVITSPSAVAAVAEVVVPLEVILGVAMLAGLRLGGYVLYAAIAMLFFFSGLVAYAWPENCGCFGPIKLGPWETLGKNLVMFLMAVCGVAALRSRPDSEPSFGVIGKWVNVLIMGALALYFTHDTLWHSEKYFSEKSGKPAQVSPQPPQAAPSTVAPSAAGTSTTPKPESAPAAPSAPEADAHAGHEHGENEEYPTAPTGMMDYPADAPADFAGYTLTGMDGAALDLGSGTYLVALLNATCDHCMATVPAINELAVRPDVPTVVALMQEPDPGSVDSFVQQTGASFPMLSLGNDFIKFSQFIKTAPPRFTLVKDGRPVKSWEGYPPTAEDLTAAVPK